MAIVRPEQMDFSNKRFNLVLAGPPGVGKTTMAMSAPDTMTQWMSTGPENAAKSCCVYSAPCTAEAPDGHKKSAQTAATAKGAKE